MGGKDQEGMDGCIVSNEVVFNDVQCCPQKVLDQIMFRSWCWVMTDATSPLLKEHSMIACGQVFSATIISIVASFSGRGSYCVGLWG